MCLPAAVCCYRRTWCSSLSTHQPRHQVSAQAALPTSRYTKIELLLCVDLCIAIKYCAVYTLHEFSCIRDAYSLYIYKLAHLFCLRQNCELCARKIAEIATSSKVVVEKSTVPVRTADAVRRVLMCNEKGIEFQVCTQQLSIHPLHFCVTANACVCGVVLEYCKRLQ
jgi:UDP-glucose/GDP-mannose dehydrogenase family, NAD binding domain